MSMYLQHRLVSRARPIEEYIVCFDKFPRNEDFDAHAEDVAGVYGLRVWVSDFVGCYAGAGAVDVRRVARCLFFYGACGVETVALVLDGSLGEARGEMRGGEEDGREV